MRAQRSNLLLARYGDWFCFTPRNDMIDENVCPVKLNDYVTPPVFACVAEFVCYSYLFKLAAGEEEMKKQIHPEFQDSVFKCACGAEIHTRSTQPEFKLEICSSCHPFFTGKQKLVDSAGRVERFMRKYGDKADFSKRKATKKAPESTERAAAGSEEKVESEEK